MDHHAPHLRRRRSLVAGTAAGVGALVVGLALPAAAHVEPTTPSVPAGSEATVEFTVQHGCDDSPTTKVEFQVPAAVTDATPLELDGWTGAVDGQVITFEGGPLPADVEAQFPVRFSVPDAPGTSLAFPFIQTCVEGSIDWIQLDPDGERPAPIVEIGDPDPSAPPTTAAPAEPADDADASTTTSGGTAITLEASTTVPAGSTAEAELAEEESDSTGGLVGAIGVLVVTVVGVGVVIALRRRGR